MSVAATPLHQPAITPAADQHSIVLGLIERKFGLLTHLQYVSVDEVVDRAADLAVADRIAFRLAASDHRQYAVFAHDGWFCIGALATPLTERHVASLKRGERNGCAQLLSVVSEKGIRPLV